MQGDVTFLRTLRIGNYNLGVNERPPPADTERTEDSQSTIISKGLQKAIF